MEVHTSPFSFFVHFFHTKNKQNTIFYFVWFRCVQCTATGEHSRSIDKTRNDNHVHDPSTVESDIFHVSLVVTVGRWSCEFLRYSGWSHFIFLIVSEFSMELIWLRQNYSIEHFNLVHWTNLCYSEKIVFFFRNGYQCPVAYNPADFLIGVLSKTDPGQELNNVAHQLCDAFEASRKDQVNERTNGFVIDEDVKKYEIQKPLWIFTVYWLIYRNLLIVARDPSIQKLRILQKIVSVFVSNEKM